MHRSNIAYILFAYLIVTSVAVAQDFPPRYSQMVRIESDPERAELYVRDSLVGTTPMKIHRTYLPEMTAWYPSRSAWNASMVDLPDSALSEIEGVVALQFSREILIHTVPGNATVYAGNRFLGRTPLRMRQEIESDTLEILKPGYQPVFLHTPAFIRNPKTIVLEPEEYAHNTDPVRTINGTLSLPTTRILTASAIGLGAGIAAVILKREADTRYTTYQQFGSRNDLDKSETYDLYSGIALTILQLSLAYLIYELFITP